MSVLMSDSNGKTADIPDAGVDAMIALGWEVVEVEKKPRPAASQSRPSK